MSKKIAEGTGALVLDVKVGSGAFMKDVERARELAETMVALGTDAGVHTVALLTDMETPLGFTAGNAIEVEESVEVLAGGGPADVVELTLALAREMLAGAGRGRRRPGRPARRRLRDGRLEGDDPRPGRRPRRRAAGRPRVARRARRPATGTLTRLDALSVGIAAWRLGAGRSRKEDPVQAGAGVRWHARPGDQVTEGQPLMTLLTDEPDRFERALEALEGGVRRLRRRRGVRARAAADRPGGLTMIELTAGQETPLTGRITLGVGWDKERTAGAIGTGAPDIDLDATAVQFVGEQLFDLAFYNNLSTRDGSVVHLGDNLTGAGEGDDEQLTVDLDRVHAPVDTIVLLVSSYQGHTLEWVNRAYCRISDEADVELARFRITGGVTQTGMVLATLKRCPTGGCCGRSARAWRSPCRRRGWRSCAVSTDPRGFGLGTMTTRAPRAGFALVVATEADHEARSRRSQGSLRSHGLGLRRAHSAAAAAGRPSRPRRPAWTRPRPRSCRRRSAACRPGRRPATTSEARPRTRAPTRTGMGKRTLLRP